MAILLGLDVGTSGTKALAVDETGKVLASATVEYPLLSPKPNWAEQRPSDWKAAAFEALSRLAASPGVNKDDIKGLGLTGQMHGSVFLDASGKVLRNALLWCDQRTAAQCRTIEEKAGGRDKLIEMVSNPAFAGFTAPKILWLRENEPEVYERVKRVLLPKDYIRYELTGEYATDVADASGTLLFDVKNRRWHTELMSLLDLPADMMPRAFEGPEVTGTLSDAAADATGLPRGLPVIAGGGDQAAGGIGTGVVREGVLSAALGTSGVVFGYANEPFTDPKGRVHTFCHSVPGKWHVMGVVLSAGGSLRWFRDALCPEECAAAKQSGRDPYEYITAGAEKAPLGAEGLVFLPYLTGERTPHNDANAKGAFIGLSLRHTHDHLSRAVLEGVAYAMRDGLDIMRGMGMSATQVRASGGGGRSAFWRRIQADVYRAQMVTINVDEGPAFGAALLASVGAGVYGSIEEACDTTIRVVAACEPDAARADAYDKWFNIYQGCYRGLAPEFERAAALL
ncbi:MAG: xylulokinase [FCB group bacterium]|jgi:xylulokinase|nr:xylulokinase [FCB group bacterium]